jgi:hypothetical protein
MADKNPAQAITMIKRIEMLCDFMENPAVVKAVQDAIPFTGITRDPGALGFDIPQWAGLGTVGIWAALDATPKGRTCLAINARSATEEAAFRNDSKTILATTKVTALRSWKTSATSMATTSEEMPTPSISEEIGTSSLLACSGR